MFALHAHLVFVTKFRHNVFGDRHLARKEEIMRAVCADFETELVEFNGENNHVHPLVNFPPKVALTKLVNSLKGVSSRRMRQEFPDLRRHYYRANKLWSGSYFAGSVGGAPLSVVRQYIERQNRPVQGTAQALAALPARAFTPALKGGALARTPVAVSDSRTLEQRAADDALTAAIAQALHAYGDTEEAYVLTEYVVVTSQQRFDEDGDGVTAVGCLYRDSDVPIHRVLGLLEYAAARSRKHITED